MYKKNRIYVVIPAYNEEKQIHDVITSLPKFVDRIVVVNDASKDATGEIVKKLASKNKKIHLIDHEKNLGAGASVRQAYDWCKNQKNIDIVVTIDGDGQMEPAEIQWLIDPLVDEGVDFTKGNRLFTGEAWKQIPRIRYFGNAFLSLLTKIASGYWHIADFQTGFTAGKIEIIRKVAWNSLYSRYGYPNVRMVLLNIVDARVRDVVVKPIYNVGEKSTMSLVKVIFTIPWLLLKSFMLRLVFKYAIKDFHPLIFFYMLGLLFGILATGLFARVFYFWLIQGLQIPAINALAAMFAFMSSSLFTLFAMWFDMEANKDLR